MLFESHPLGLSGNIDFEGDNGDMPGPFDRSDQLSMMNSAGSGDSSGDDFPLFGDESQKGFLIFIIDVLNVVFTEAADSFFNAYHFKSFILKITATRVREP